MKPQCAMININKTGFGSIPKNNNKIVHHKMTPFPCNTLSKKLTPNINNKYSLVPKLNLSHDVNLPMNFNQMGEAPLDEAPQIRFNNTKLTTPQQFLHYERTRSNVEHILSKIKCSDNFPLFVHEENDCLFIQVGIIGHENYPRDKETKVRPKIVYSRRWYIEPYMPTSEVIQTAYIAIIKAREHEFREYFHLYIQQGDTRYRTTPFNTHMDLPLMANNTEYFDTISKNLDDSDIPNKSAHLADIDLPTFIKSNLAQLKFGKLNFQLTDFQQLNDTTYFLSISLISNGVECQTIEKYFSEQVNATHQLVITQEDLGHSVNEENLEAFINTMFYELFQSMLKKCSAHISQIFEFEGFARFNNQLSVKKIAQFSAETRIVDNSYKTEGFQQVFKQMVSTVDSQKAPPFSHNTVLYNTQTKLMDQYESMDGYLPTSTDQISIK